MNERNEGSCRVRQTGPPEEPTNRGLPLDRRLLKGWLDEERLQEVRLSRLFDAAKVSETMTGPRLSVPIHRTSSLFSWECGKPQRMRREGITFASQTRDLCLSPLPCFFLFCFYCPKFSLWSVFLAADQDRNAKSA